jgi:hypothetical protein
MGDTDERCLSEGGRSMSRRLAAVGVLALAACGHHPHRAATPAAQLIAPATETREAADPTRGLADTVDATLPTAAAPDPHPRAAKPRASRNRSERGSECTLAFIREHESNNDYQAVNPNGHYGAYQFSQATWNTTARNAGRSDLAGVNPRFASPRDQDAMAQHLLTTVGAGQWSVC